MSKQDNALEVWLDDDLGPPCLVGTLAHDRGQIRFHYERDWFFFTTTGEQRRQPGINRAIGYGDAQAPLGACGYRLDVFPCLLQNCE